jgi:hypothetical protein
MSRQPRCLLIDYLAKNNMINDNYVSWAGTKDGNKCYPENGYKFRWWRPETLVIQDTWKNMNTLWHTEPIGSYMLPPEDAFKDSAMSLIAESHVDEFFVTEKTALAIFHKRPFLVFSQPNWHKNLKRMGFELFEEIVDYEFDNEIDQEKRCEMLISQLKRLVDWDYNDLLSITKNKTEHNYNKLLNYKKRKSAPKIIQQIFKYKAPIIGNDLPILNLRKLYA